MNSKSTHISKNGLNITVRAGRMTDADALLQLKLGYIRNTTTIPLFEDEYKNSFINEETKIQKYIEEKNSHLLVAEYEGELIGNIDLKGSQRRKLFHTAMIGMGLSYEWQGLGIGTILLKEMTKFAIENEYLEILQLDVYDTNLAGKRLYINLGFEECGRIKGFFKEGDKQIDNVQMVKYLKELK